MQPSKKTTILLVEDDERDRKMLLGPLQAKYLIEVAVDFSTARSIIGKGGFDVVFLDLMLPRKKGDRIDESGKLGLDLLKLIRENEPLTPVVVISGLASVKTALKVLQEGIVDFIVKDDLEDQLPIVMRKAELIRQGRVEQLILRREARWSEEGRNLVFKSKLMRRALDQVSAIAQTDVSVLLSGETGTGKELVAREIHNRSLRSASPFVPVNCGAIPATLVESELFGYEKGAFTGADKRKYGLIELAHQGTLFLDEIADLPLNLQVKLLRALQEGTIRRIGGEKEFAVNVRIIAATNKDLALEIKAGRFRSDLFYRLAYMRFELPPLRERTEDIPILAKHFIERHRPGSELSLSPNLLKLLKSHPWPGNVRELESVVQRMLMNPIERGKKLQPADVKGCLDDVSQTPDEIKAEQFDLMQIEKQAIAGALERFGSQAEACKRLGISESQLRRKIKDYGIAYRRFVRRDARAESRKSHLDWRSILLQLATNEREFTTQQAITALGGVSRKTAISHLNALASIGELERISRGKYRGRNVHTIERV